MPVYIYATLIYSISFKQMIHVLGHDICRKMKFFLFGYIYAEAYSYSL